MNVGPEVYKFLYAGAIILGQSHKEINNIRNLSDPGLALSVFFFLIFDIASASYICGLMQSKIKKNKRNLSTGTISILYSLAIIEIKEIENGQ